MARAKMMSTEDIENLIEQKLLEMLGDPDSGLHLKKEFKFKLKQRLRKSSSNIPHEEVLKKFA